MSEPLVNKVAALKPTSLSKKDSNTGAFLWNLRNFKIIFFQEHLRTTANNLFFAFLLQRKDLLGTRLAQENLFLRNVDFKYFFEEDRFFCTFNPNVGL